MKNPFEKFPSRLQEHDDTTEKKENLENQIDDLKYPLGHLQTNDILANACYETFNAVLALPSTPERKILEMRVKMAHNKLEKIYKKDEKDAHRLNEKYSKIVKKSIETGDDSEREKFEKEMLGME